MNNPEQVLISGTLITDVSDHFSQFCILSSTRDKIKRKQIKKRDLSHFNPDRLNSDFATIDWRCIIKTHAYNVDELFSTFYRNFNNIINKHAPIKTLSQRRIKQFSKPWVTKGIRTSMKEKNRLYKVGDQEKYKYYRNKICSLTRLSKKHYYCAFFNNNLNNMKQTWQGINKLLNRYKRKCKSVGKLKEPDNNNNLTNNSSRIPNILDKHFSNVGNILASKLPPADRPFSEYLSKSGSPEFSFFFKPVTPSEIQFQILSIPNSKSRGLYSCPTQLLKYSSEVISTVLSDILNTSVSLGAYPKKLKISKIIPIYKADDETDPSNYRPISLLSNFNRIFEKIMYNRMRDFIEKHSLLYSSQHGFRHGQAHSTNMLFLIWKKPYKPIWTKNSRSFHVAFLLT